MAPQEEDQPLLARDHDDANHITHGGINNQPSSRYWCSGAAAAQMGAVIAKRLEKGDGTTEADEDRIIPDHKRNRRRTRFLNGLKRFRYAAEDWLYLALLGISMGLMGLAIDYIIDQINDFHYWAYSKVVDISDAPSMYAATAGVWIGYAVILVTVSAILTHYIAAQAIGSGLPEMKTILRGVVLKEYLTIRTMVSKIIGITLAVGSGIPVGKEGPFVHISSALASQLSRLVHGFKGIYENESRSSEMLAAGCAVGVACTFSAPIGGVLFSIEVTSVFFAVRNYWRGFFAAACSALVTRILLPVIKDPELDLNAVFQTRFTPGRAFTLQELPIFAFMGLCLGFVGAAFVFLHHKLVMFLRRNSLAKKIFQRYWVVYAAFIAFVVAVISYPEGLGRFMNGRMKFSKTIGSMFENCTWFQNYTGNYTCSKNITEQWQGHDEETSIFVSLAIFQIVNFFLAIACATIPTPNGVFMPLFIIGAAFGRLTGETFAYMCGGELLGLGTTGARTQPIVPGVYAVVGAAALAGAVTHTISVTVIAFEVTGQMLFLLPVMIAVIIANAVSSYLQPSIYDSIIRMKHLPYLPDIRTTNSLFHSITIDRVMVSPVQFLSRDSTYRHLQSILTELPRIRAFPIVDSDAGLVLLGSVNRQSLLRIIDEKVGTEPRRREATSRVRSAIRQANLATQVQAGKEGEGKARPRNRFTIVPVSRDSSIDEPDDEEQVQRRKAKVQEHIQKTLANLGVKGEERKRNESSGALSHSQSNSNTVTTIGGLFRSLTRMSFHIHKRDSKEADPFDLYGEERDAWEREAMDEVIDLSSVLVDPSPFQLVSHTSLFKVHSLFSLLGLNRAYVTQAGKLVGVVALHEVRDAIEKAQSGQLLPPREEDEGTESGDEEGKKGGGGGEDTDDDSDYEDNLLGMVEVVRPNNGVCLDSAKGEGHPFALSVDSLCSLPTGNAGERRREAMALSRAVARRNSQRMDEMAVSRRRSGSRNSLAKPVHLDMGYIGPAVEEARAKGFRGSLPALPTTEEWPLSPLAAVHEEPRRSPRSRSKTLPEDGSDTSRESPVEKEKSPGEERRSEGEDSGGSSSSPDGSQPLRPKRHVQFGGVEGDEDGREAARRREEFRKKRRPTGPRIHPEDKDREG